MPLELPRISVSVKAALTRDDHVLLLSYDDDLAGFHYNLPGGRAREGECLRDAVARKVDEETGIPVVAERLLFVVEYVPTTWGGEFGKVQKVQFNFAVEPVGDRLLDPRFSDPRDPIQLGFEWVPIDRLGSIPLLPRVGAQLQSALRAHDVDRLVDRW